MYDKMAEAQLGGLVKSAKQLELGSVLNCRQVNGSKDHLLVDEVELEEDPVLENLLRGFDAWEEKVKEMLNLSEKGWNSIAQLCFSFEEMSKQVLTIFGKGTDQYITRDACQYRSAVQGATRSDTRQTACGKIKGDWEYNLLEPLRSHCHQNTRLRNLIGEWRARKSDLALTRRWLGEVMEQDIEAYREAHVPHECSSLASGCYHCENDKSWGVYQNAMDSYEQVHTSLIEWLLLIDAYKNDIFDSVLNSKTILEHDFFAAMAQNMGTIVPARTEFRPMVEMIPSLLQPLVQMEIREWYTQAKTRPAKMDAMQRILSKSDSVLQRSVAPEAAVKGGFSKSQSDETLLLDTIDDNPVSREELSRSFEWPPQQVDPINVSLLCAQGHDPSMARKALEASQGDMQGALDWLLNRRAVPRKVLPGSEEVRIPTTLQWVEKFSRIKADRRRHEKSGKRVNPFPRDVLSGTDSPRLAVTALPL